MRQEDLPHGDARPALDFPHFPTRQQAFVWRNWGTVATERLAAVLSTGTEEVCRLAGEYHEVMNIPGRYFESFDSDKKMKIFKNNAIEFYELDIN